LGPFRVRAVGFYQNPLVSLGFPSVLAVEAVIGEPVSGLVFPVTRENTGNFCLIQPQEWDQALFSAQ